VVLIKVTETHKWHISGSIVDAHPSIPHVDSEKYFRERAEARAKATSKSEEELQSKTEVRIIEEKVLLKVRPEQFVLHLLGMLLVMLGTYATLKALNTQTSSSTLGL
jgi:hypothetical protein